MLWIFHFLDRMHCICIDFTMYAWICLKKLIRIHCLIWPETRGHVDVISAFFNEPWSSFLGCLCWFWNPLPCFYSIFNFPAISSVWSILGTQFFGFLVWQLNPQLMVGNSSELSFAARKPRYFQYTCSSSVESV